MTSVQQILGSGSPTSVILDYPEEGSSTRGAVGWPDAGLAVDPPGVRDRMVQPDE
jgi:hypothetical protein